MINLYLRCANFTGFFTSRILAMMNVYNISCGPSDSSNKGIHHLSSLVSFKEIFILLVFGLLLLYSIISFLKKWNKNYRDIPSLSYQAICIDPESKSFIWMMMMWIWMKNGIEIEVWIRDWDCDMYGYLWLLEWQLR